MKLNIIKDYCKNLFDTNKIIVLNYNFPSFSITEDSFKAKTLEIIEDKIRLGIDCGTYGKEYSSVLKNITYDDFVEAQKHVLIGDATIEQQKRMIVLEKIVYPNISKNESFNVSELSKKTLNEICVENIKYSLINLESVDCYANPNGNFGKVLSTNFGEKEKYIATMLLLKEQIPNAYKQINLSLQNYPNQSLVSELKSLEKNPNLTVVKFIKDIDPKMSEKLFPKEHNVLVKQDIASETITGTGKNKPR